jgi:hypothetical protein
MAETDTNQTGNDAVLSKALGGVDLSGLSDIYTKEAQAKGDVETAKLKQQQTELSGVAKAKQDYATGLRQQYAAAEPTLMSAPPKFSVTKDTQEGLTGLAALMTVGGLIIGSKGMTSGTNAMNAMTGVLKGYQEGNKERIAFETQKYEKEMEAWKTNLQQTRDSLARYEKLAASDLNAATAQAAADAAAKGQDVIAAGIKANGISYMRQRVDKVIDQTMTTTSQLRNAMAEATGGLGPRAALAKVFGAEAAAKTPEKTAEKISGSINSIKSTIDLIKQAQDTDIKFGELGRMTENLSAAFRRNLGADNSELSPQSVSASIDQAAKESGLSPNSKNVTFYKDAIFTALELERQARGGSILPVAVMKTLGPLLDPKNMAREDYIEILRRRAQEVARLANLTQEQLDVALSGPPGATVKLPSVPAAPAGKQTTSDGWTLEGP